MRQSLPPPFAYTPGGTASHGYDRESSTTSSRPSSSHQYFPPPPMPRLPSQSPHAMGRGSLQGWTNGEDREGYGQMRKITPSGGSLADLMNPSPEASTGASVRS